MNLYIFITIIVIVVAVHLKLYKRDIITRIDDRIIVDTTTHQFLELTGHGSPTPIYKLAPLAARKVLESVQNVNVPYFDVDSQDITIGDVSMHVVRPLNTRDKILPCVIYFHGGGWILGSEHTHDRLIREIAVGADCVVVFVNYTPSPEVQYPIAIHQGYDALTSVYANADALGINPLKIAVAGDSVGGNMATVVALMSTRMNGPRISYQLLLYPVVGADFNTPSYNKYQNGPWLTRAAMKWFWDSYCPDVSARLNPLISPIQASLDELSHMPPTLVVVNEYDVLLSEGEVYARRLQQAGVSVSCVRYNGAIHDCAMLNGLRSSPVVDTLITNSINSLRSALSDS